MGFAALRKTAPCVWMSAGLLTYRLCDREYDCEHCPLDVALRGGDSLQTTGSDPSVVEVDWMGRFPHDRRYSDRHLWLRPVDDRSGDEVRVGLDAFAAAMIGLVRAVSTPASGESVEKRAILAELEVGSGVLPVGCPVAGTISASNDALRSDATLLTSDPYEGGWLVELDLADGEQADLLTGDQALEAADVDLRWFRRRVACYMFADATAAGPSLADGGEILTDLRQILGTRRYARLLRELFS